MAADSPAPMARSWVAGTRTAWLNDSVAAFEALQCGLHGGVYALRVALRDISQAGERGFDLHGLLLQVRRQAVQAREKFAGLLGEVPHGLLGLGGHRLPLVEEFCGASLGPPNGLPSAVSTAGHGHHGDRDNAGECRDGQHQRLSVS